MVDWVDTGLETLDFEEDPTEVVVDPHTSHPLVFVHAFGTHHPNGGFRHLLKVLSRSYGKELY